MTWAGGCHPGQHVGREPVAGMQVPGHEQHPAPGRAVPAVHLEDLFPVNGGDDSPPQGLVDPVREVGAVHPPDVQGLVVGDDPALAVRDEDVLDVGEVCGLHDEPLYAGAAPVPAHHARPGACLEGADEGSPFSLSMSSMFLLWVCMLSMVTKMKIGTMTTREPMITQGDMRIQAFLDVLS